MGGDWGGRRGGSSAAEEHEGDGGLEFVEAVPGVQFGEVVFAEQEEELRFRKARLKGFDGIDGKTGAAAFQFDRVDRELLRACDRGFQQPASHFRCGLGSGFEFVRVDPGGHEYQPVELE